MFDLKYKDRVTIKKWLGVNGSRTLKFSLKGKRWRLLRVISRATKNILKGSSCTERSLSTNFNARFIIETIDSPEITIHLFNEGLNFNLTTLLVK